MRVPSGDATVFVASFGAGFSPFFSYTESFLPVAGRIDNGDGSFGDPYRPQTGTQYEAGIKWQPTPDTLITATAFKIKERNRVLYLAAGVLFILALRGLSSPESSRLGNMFGIAGMTIAVLTTLAAHPPTGRCWTPP